MLADHGVVAFGQFQDELVRAGQLGGLHHRLQRRGRVGQGDVLAHAAVEQQVLLQHHADLAAQLGGSTRPSHAVDQDPAAFRHIQALHQFGQRALAGAGAADDADDLAGRDVEVSRSSTSGALGAVAESAPGRT